MHILYNMNEIGMQNNSIKVYRALRKEVIKAKFKTLISLIFNIKTQHILISIEQVNKYTYY